MTHAARVADHCQVPLLAAGAGQSAHLVGICGSGMSALASLLVDLGWRVSGSDLNAHGPIADGLRLRGVTIREGHGSANLPQSAQIVVSSAAIPAANPEREAARAGGLPDITYSRMLGRLMQGQMGVCVAGTHGKSTVTAMTAVTLRRSGRDPSACMGAEPCDLGRSGWAGSGALFVVEGCEYQRSFLDLSPAYAAILSIEPDHFDCYADFAQTRAAFREFASRVAPSGLLLVRADCAASAEAALGASARVESFSLDGEADWRIADLRETPVATRFTVLRRGRSLGRFSTRLPGRHNALNALASIALCDALGVDVEEIRASVADFRGVRRRFEQIGTWEGVSWVDDYAHHPTAVRATLDAARARFRKRRIWSVFQPHQVSRTRALLREFAGSFSQADEIVLSKVYVARESDGGAADLASRELAAQICSVGGRVRYCPDLDQMVATLEDETRPGDVVILMGAGDINRVHHEFTRRFQRHRAS